MITLFSVPKSFHGHIDLIQRNAIQSWLQLRPVCEIILLGDDEGTAEVAREFGVRHIPKVARNEYGTPLVSDLFEQAQRAATYNLLCYVNADIILLSDFLPAVERIARRKRRFLMVGQRWDVEIAVPWDFDSAQWEAELRACVRERGQLHAKSGIDYFVFPKRLFGAIPEFAIGRTAWDNWLIYRVWQRLASVVDATDVVIAVHQNHTYGVLGSKKAVWTGTEAQRNRALMGKGEFTLADATHLLSANQISFAWWPDRVLGYFQRLTDPFPVLGFPVQAAKMILAISRPIRSALGLTFSARMGKSSPQ